MPDSTDDRPTLTLAHSPDLDDVFMWWPLQGAIDTGRFQFKLIGEDIQSLNERAIATGDLDITAISIHTYPHVRDRYALTSCGSSMGDGYGPRIVAREPRGEGHHWLADDGVRIATPGKQTTAHLMLQIMLGEQVLTIPMPFDRIMGAVSAGEVDAGLVIHEGQLTYADAGLSLIADLGAWWRGETGLPLPLGGNVIRRDLDERFGAGSLEEVSAILTNSVEHALANRETSIERAMEYAPGLDESTANQFISMYVNNLTLDAGARGLEAIRALLGKAHTMGLIPDPGEIELVYPSQAAAK
jgi:5,8-dihydroxy-2-naphthoate synthase